jgi:hypothetical protein
MHRRASQGTGGMLRWGWCSECIEVHRWGDGSQSLAELSAMVAAAWSPLWLQSALLTQSHSLDLLPLLPLPPDTLHIPTSTSKDHRTNMSDPNRIDVSFSSEDQ